jgi:streptogramin lyase
MLSVRKIAMPLLAGCAFFSMTGCVAAPNTEVPQAAVLKTEGDQRIVYTADAAGVVWVTNAGTNDVLYSGAVLRGDRLVLDAQASTVTLNDQVVANKGIAPGDHQVYFRGGPGAAQVTRDSTAVRPGQVPMSASLQGEGMQLVEYTANTDGSIWVTDTDSNSIVYAGRVLRGESVVVNPTGPKDDQLTVAQRPVLSGDLPAHNRRIFFQAGPELTPDEAAAAAQAAGATVTDRPVDVSLRATLRSEGEGATRFIADTDGTVWVVDAATNTVLYSGRMLRNDGLTVDPIGDHLMLNGRSVYDRSLPPNDRYRVFFQGPGL